MSSALTEFLCKALSDALSNGRARSRSAQIVSQHVACLEVVGDARIDEAADFNQILIVGFAAQVFHHHLNGIDGRNGVHFVLTCVFWSGAVNGFEERMVVADVA